MGPQSSVMHLLLFKHSAFVRITTAKLLLECLNDSEDAQVFYCKNIDSQLQFTPLFGSPIVINASAQKDVIFKDVSSIRKFQQHCISLGKYYQEQTKAAKCWIYEPKANQH